LCLFVDVFFRDDFLHDVFNFLFSIDWPNSILLENPTCQRNKSEDAHRKSRWQEKLLKILPTKLDQRTFLRDVLFYQKRTDLGEWWNGPSIFASNDKNKSWSDDWKSQPPLLNSLAPQIRDSQRNASSFSRDISPQPSKSARPDWNKSQKREARENRPTLNTSLGLNLDLTTSPTSCNARKHKSSWLPTMLNLLNLLFGSQPSATRWAFLSSLWKENLLLDNSSAWRLRPAFVWRRCETLTTQNSQLCAKRWKQSPTRTLKRAEQSHG